MSKKRGYQTVTTTPQRRDTQYQINTKSLLKGECVPLIKKGDTATLPPRPTVVFTPKAKQKTDLIIDTCQKEVGWFCLVDTSQTGFLIIEDVFVPKQTVSSVETDIDAQDEINMVLALDDAGVDITKLIGWFHSHVNMDVGPSAQDEHQTECYIEKHPVFLRGIMNKKGEAKFDVYYRDAGIAHTNLSWYTQLDSLSQDEIQELKDTLRTNVVAQTYGYTNYYLPKPTTPLFQPNDYDHNFNYSNWKNRDTGFGIDWDHSTPENKRPANWHTDPWYLEDMHSYDDTDEFAWNVF